MRATSKSRRNGPREIEEGEAHERRWVQCAQVDARENDIMSPISLTGPPADTIAPRQIGRRIPAGAT